jgi:prophage antirepressor-like protein
MNNKLQVFNNDEFKIQTIMLDGEPYFVGKEVAKLLGYSNSRKAIRDHVDIEDRRGEQIVTPGGKQKTIIINESGLYSLILSSKLDSAKRFKKWVTKEVLPQIRKTGAYKLPEIEYAESLRMLADKIEENEALKLDNKIKQQQIMEMKPKADYCDKILSSKSLVTITQIAKDYGMSGKAMNQILHELNIQYKQSNQWLLYYQHQNKGYTSSETIEIPREDGTVLVKMNTKWTQKGRLYLYERLKKKGYLPLIEQDI